MKHSEKVFVIVYRIIDNSLELLALKPTPEPNRSATDYVVTGGVEEYDKSFTDAALREVKEEIGVESNKIVSLEHSIEYIDHITSKKYIEHCFGVKINEEPIMLNEEHINYRWLNKDDFINTIWWDYDKSVLEKMIKIIEGHEHLD